MRIVYTSRTVAEARFVQNLLEGEGIQATLRGEMLASIAGDVPLDQAMPRVLVEDEDAARAEEVVAEYLGNAEVGDAPAWTCEACGETHEPQFGACWKCGHAKP